VNVIALDALCAWECTGTKTMMAAANVVRRTPCQNAISGFEFAICRLLRDVFSGPRWWLLYARDGGLKAI